MPDKVLEELVGILLLDHQASSADNVAGVLDELLAIGRELVNVDGRVVEDIVESLVDLGVVGHATFAEGFDDAIQTNLRHCQQEYGRSMVRTDLSVDVGLFVGLVDGIDDGALCGMCADIFGSSGERHGWRIE